MNDYILTLVIYLLNSGKNINEIFVIVEFFTLLRLLPAVSKIVQSIQSIKYNYAVIDIVYKKLYNLENKKKFNTENRDKIMM